MNQTEKSRPRPTNRGAADKQTEQRSTNIVAAPTDMQRYRHRRHVRRACRRTWEHLVTHGLMSDLVRQVLDDIDSGWSA